MLVYSHFSGLLRMIQSFSIPRSDSSLSEATTCLSGLRDVTDVEKARVLTKPIDLGLWACRRWFGIALHGDVVKVEG